MTPERAAEVLGVAGDADRHDVERAFQRRARATHPDAAETPDPDAFHEAEEARRVLLGRADSDDAGAVADPTRVVVYRDAPRIQGPVLIVTWAGMLVVAAVLAIVRAPYPLTLAEPLVRWTVLIASAVAFAATGRRRFAVVAVAAELATLATVILVTTFGGLVGMLITLPALLGAFTGGIARWRLAHGGRG